MHQVKDKVGLTVLAPLLERKEQVMDISLQYQQTLASMLSSLSLPITITPQTASTGNSISYNWQWHKYSGSEKLFKDALNDAHTQTMNTVQQYAPPDK